MFSLSATKNDKTKPVLTMIALGSCVRKTKKFILQKSLIKAWREHFGLTQAGLAEKAGMKQAALARLECGNSTPRRATLDRLAHAMGLEIGQLVE